MSFLINPYRFGGPSDPSFSSVVLLLHGNGADGSTVIADSSTSTKTITAIGDAQIDTAQSKWGGSSILYDGSGDGLSVADSADWNPAGGDYTAECWLRLTALPAGGLYFNIMNQRASAIFCPFCWLINSSGNLQLWLSFDNANWTPSGTYAIQGGTLSTATWYHVAWARSGSSFKMFLDGTQVGSTYTNASAFTDSASAMRIGWDTNWQFNGWMDDVRLTKGVARYTSNFTAPIAEFPNQ